MMKIVEIDPEFKRFVDANDGYCPCALVKNEDTKCICRAFREQESAGPCACGRYEKRMD